MDTFMFVCNAATRCVCARAACHKDDVCAYPCMHSCECMHVLHMYVHYVCMYDFSVKSAGFEYGYLYVCMYVCMYVEDTFFSYVFPAFLYK
jgi:hypothetical protein